MRGLVESSSLARAITRTTKSQPRVRSYSTGIGRGRGRHGFGKLGETEDAIFNNSNNSGSGQDHGVTPSLNPPGRGLGRGPLLSNISHGRGAGPLHSPPPPGLNVSDSKTMPSLGLGIRGFGRGKPVQDSSPVEDPLASERSAVLPKWSKWDEKLKDTDPRDGASPAELRLMGMDAPSSVLKPLPKQSDGGAQGWQQPYPAQPFQATPSPVTENAGQYHTYYSGQPSSYEHAATYGAYGQPGMEQPYAYNQEAGQAATYGTQQETPVDYQSGDWNYNAAAYEQSSLPNQWQYQYDHAQTATQAGDHQAPPTNAPMEYETKIEECFKEGKFKEIDAIYTEMKSSQVRASVKTYGTLIKTYIEMKQMDKVSLLCQEMEGAVNEIGKPQEANAGPSVPEALSVESNLPEDKNAKFYPTESATTEYDHAQPGHAGQGEYQSSYGQAAFSESGFPSSGSQVPSAGPGMGRGKKAESFFNFDFSQKTSSIGSSTGYAMGTMQADDYSQTFKPVLQPGWHAFAPHGGSVGPGAGRGRTTSTPTLDLGIGSGTMFSSEQIDVSVETGRSSYSQRMDAALQRAASKQKEKLAEPQYDYPEETSQPSLSEQEAGERAMSILNARMSRRYTKLEDWSRDDDEGTQVKRRTPQQLARISRQKRDPRKELEELEAKQAAEAASKMTDEEAKKEAERLKAIEENKEIEELFETFTEFMKCYGEMALEPEHELGDFTNPDIDEKPMMPFDEYLQKAKPNIMKTGLFRSEEEWQKMFNEALKLAPYYEEFAQRYGGPGRYTAKQENEDLEEIASALPLDVGAAAQSFVQRSLTTLKSNPGFNLDEKQWMLAAMVDEFSQYSVSS